MVNAIIIILYLVISIIFASILIRYENLNNDFGDFILLGFISFFWIFIVPILLIACAGNLLYKKLFNKE